MSFSGVSGQPGYFGSLLGTNPSAFTSPGMNPQAMSALMQLQSGGTQSQTPQALAIQRAIQALQQAGTSQRPSLPPGASRLPPGAQVAPGQQMPGGNPAGQVNPIGGQMNALANGLQNGGVGAAANGISPQLKTLMSLDPATLKAVLMKLGIPTAPQNPAQVPSLSTPTLPGTPTSLGTPSLTPGS